MKNKACIFFAGFLVLSDLGLPQAFAASAPQKNTGNSGETLPSSAEITHQLPVKDEVRLLRSERAKKMPYLNKALIRAEITPQKVAEKQKFVAARQGKNLNEVIDRAITLFTPARS